jgi:hypothetical protein
MFATADSLAKPTPYKSSIIPKMDVSFMPIKNSSGGKNYVAIIEDDEPVGLPLDYTSNSDIANSVTEFSKLYKNGEIYATPTPGDDSDDDEDIETKRHNLFSLGSDPVNVFYIGSITVVGLYILFRILSKNK